MKLEAGNHRKMATLLYNTEPLILVTSMESYFKERPPDCSLFSGDNFEISVHKEVLYQTPFLRRMIKSFNMDSCCSKIEILCPSMKKEELVAIVQFLYNGKIIRTDHTKVASQFSSFLTELFGFPQIDENGNSKQSITESSPKKRKFSLNSDLLVPPVDVSIKEEPEDNCVST